MSSYSSHSSSSRFYSRGESWAVSHAKKFKNQDFDSLREELLYDNDEDGRKLFQDPEFPVENEADVQWLRPKEICSDPRMIVEKHDRFDVNQGELGNCWFLAALANLAENADRFNRVVPNGQEDFESKNYAGIFRFRFWKQLEWHEVVIDDRLPTRNGKLIYAHSDDHNEFWGALLEKAYAKYYGSYKSLEGGLALEAAVDFTGGIPEIYDCVGGDEEDPERLFKIMSTGAKRGAFMASSLSESVGEEAESKGLNRSHAYSITGVVQLDSIIERTRLIRIRDPHGSDREWNGRWRDGDQNWNKLSQDERNKIQLNFGKDGEFYMSFEDFRLYFGTLEICHLDKSASGAEEREAKGQSIDEEEEKRFDCFAFKGSWIRGITAGGCGNKKDLDGLVMNPKFFFKLNDPDPTDEADRCPVIISLSQKVDKRKAELSVGFRVYKLRQEEGEVPERFFRKKKPIARTDVFENRRDVSKRLMLPEGRYCVLPSTFDKGDEAEFVVRIYVEKYWGYHDDSTPDEE